MGLNNIDLPPTLIIDLSVSYGGSCSRVLSLLEHLPRGSAALAVLENAEITKRARSLNLPFFTVGLKKSDPLIVYRLIRIIRDYGFCVLDTQNIQSKFWGSLAAARTNTALISTLNSWHSEEHGGRLKGRIFQIIETATSRKLDLYIAVSQQILQRLLKMGVRREMIAMVSNAIELKKPPVFCNRRWLSNKFGLPNKAIVFCAVGRLEWVKGFEDLISAFSRITSSVPYLCGLIIGEGSLYRDLRSLIARKGLQDRIKLTGFRRQEEVISVLNASDLFVMPSRFEGTPVALLEAAALGLPILATRVGGIPELVKDGEHALLTLPGDIEALSAALLELCQNSKLARQLGARAQKRIKKDFSLKAQVEATQKAYKTALRHAHWRIRYNKNYTAYKHTTMQK